MARVQVAHRRHERDRGLSAEPFPQTGNGVDDVHVGYFGASTGNWCSGPGKVFAFTAFT